MLHRKKPLVVDANQLTGEMTLAQAKEIGVCFGHAVNCNRSGAHVHPIQGTIVPVKIGEWIVEESGGLGYYPIADETFRASYDAIDYSDPAEPLNDLPNGDPNYADALP